MIKTCSIDGCVNIYYAKGFCHSHYIATRIGKHNCATAGCPNFISSGEHCTKHKKCKINDCEEKYHAKGFCRKHWYEASRTLKRKPCLAPNCPRKAQKYDFCSKHYIQFINNLPFDNDRKGANNSNWKGGVADYPNHNQMKKMRKQKITDVGQKCEDCKESPKILHLHHLDKTKYNHSLENFKLLCPLCHRRYHKNDRLERV